MDRGSEKGFVAYIAALGLLAGFLTYLLASSSYVSALRVATLPSLLVFGVLSFLSETLAFPVPRSKGSTVSVASLPNWAMIPLFGPFWAAVAATVADQIVEIFVRRKEPKKAIFNLFQIYLSMAIAGAVYMLLGGRVGVFAFSSMILPLLAGVAAYSTVNRIAVTAAMTIREGTDFRVAWSLVAGWDRFFLDIWTIPLVLLLVFLYGGMGILGPIAIFVPLLLLRHLYKEHFDLKQSYRDTVVALIGAIEANDEYTAGHSARVGYLAREIALAMGLPYKKAEKIEIGGYLHDVGKIWSHYQLYLKKSDELSEAELERMRKHPLEGASMVGRVSFLQGEIEKMVRHHHERWDGTGYPAGMAGEEIPIGSRIINVADAYDAMMTDRPYRGAKGLDYVREQFHLNAGKQFDPAVVETVLDKVLPTLPEGRVPVEVVEPPEPVPAVVEAAT